MIRMPVKLDKASSGALFVASAAVPMLLCDRVNVAFAVAFVALALATPVAVAGSGDITGMVERVQPAVVTIQVKSGEGGADGDVPNASEMLPGHNFLRDFHQPDRRLGRFHSQGSGFFISSDGLIVTSKHVIDGAVRILVTTHVGEQREARVVGADKLTDLALLSIDSAGQSRPFVRFATRPARVGERIVALGNPYGLGGSVTSGIVSANGRNVGQGGYDDYLQIDAAINRGNSGGPTFDSNGDVIGVNTAIFSPTGSSVGIAFAIPAATAADVAENLRRHGRVDRGWLGLDVQAITPEIASGLGRHGTSGALVIDISDTGPAARSGIRIGDVIETIDDRDVTTSRDFVKRVSGATPGQAMKLEVRRDADRLAIAATVGRRGPTDASNPTGSTIRSANIKLSLAPAHKLNGGGDPGLIVTGIDSANGDAADLDLMVGDTILRAGGRDVAALNDIEDERVAARAKKQSHLLLFIRRDDTRRFVAVRVNEPDAAPTSADYLVLSAR